MVPEFANATIRELIEGSYRIVYQMDSSQDTVQIITVHHSKKEFLLVWLQLGLSKNRLKEFIFSLVKRSTKAEKEGKQVLAFETENSLPLPKN